MSILMLLREAFCTLQRLAVVLFLRTQIYDPFESSEVCQPIFRPALLQQFCGIPSSRQFRLLLSESRHLRRSPRELL